jgi:dihydrofolate reductase
LKDHTAEENYMLFRGTYTLHQIQDSLSQHSENQERIPDTFFPEINPEQWKQVSNENFSKDGKHLYDYSFQKWVRK